MVAPGPGRGSCPPPRAAPGAASSGSAGPPSPSAAPPGPAALARAKRRRARDPSVPSHSSFRPLPRVALQQPGGRPPPGRGMLPPGAFPGWGLSPQLREAGRGCRQAGQVWGEKAVGKLLARNPLSISLSRLGLGFSALTSGARCHRGARGERAAAAAAPHRSQPNCSWRVGNPNSQSTSSLPARPAEPPGKRQAARSAPPRRWLFSARGSPRSSPLAGGRGRGSGTSGTRGRWGRGCRWSFGTNGVVPKAVTAATCTKLFRNTASLCVINLLR